MSIATFTTKTPLETLLEQNSYSRSRLRGNPLTVTFLPTFDGLHVLWGSVNQQLIDLECEVQNCSADVVAADDNLDDFVVKHASAVLLCTSNDRKHELFTMFYGNKSPSDFAKPVLSKQLAAMGAWVDKLNASAYPTLVALAPVLTPLLAAANTAVANLGKATTKLKIFNTVGARKDLVDTMNAARKATEGKIGELINQNQQLMLPPTFPSRFFKALRPTAEDPTLDELLEKQKKLTDEATALQKPIDALRAEALKTTTDAGKRDANLKLLADAQAAKAVADAKVAEIQALLDPPKK